MLVVHLLVDTCDAMGANLVNTLCEALATTLADLAGGQVALRILSNLVDRSVVTATARFPLRGLAPNESAALKARDGIVLAIIGRPNAGKSSLLNALSGQESAIVTDIPGTTRDVLREQIDLDGIPVHVADTAGIRETDDVIEAEGVRRAREALDGADIVLLVEDASVPDEEHRGLHAELPAHATVIRVANKVDLLGVDAGAEDGRAWISARTGQGLAELRQRIRAAVGAADRALGRDDDARDRARR